MTATQQAAFARKRPLGSHRFMQLVVCDRCGHKEDWSPAGFGEMRDHIDAHLESEAAAR